MAYLGSVQWFLSHVSRLLLWHVSLSVCLSICLSVCLSVYLSICLSVCLSVCYSHCGNVSKRIHLSSEFFTT